MSSTAYLGGGGTSEQEAAIWRRMLAQRPRILYWPFALDGEMLRGAEGWLRASLQAFQPGLDVETWTQLDGHQCADLADFDLLFIGGGNTFDLLAHLRAHGALDWVRTFMDGGGALYGGSAGAVLAGASIAIAAEHDENNTHLSETADLAGLALLGRHAVLPHYKFDMRLRAQNWCVRHASELLGVPETAGLVVVGDQVTVAGTDPVWRLTGETAAVFQPGDTITTGTGAGS